MTNKEKEKEIYDTLKYCAANQDCTHCPALTDCENGYIFPQYLALVDHLIKERDNALEQLKQLTFTVKNYSKSDSITYTYDVENRNQSGAGLYCARLP